MCEDECKCIIGLEIDYEDTGLLRKGVKHFWHV